MSKKVLVPLANGFEEIEFVSIVDTLRRADIEVLIAGVGECSVSDEDSDSGAKSSSASSVSGSKTNTVGERGTKAHKSASQCNVASYTGAHGILIRAEAMLDSLDSSALAEFDGVALAGGWQGMLNLKASQKLREILREFKSQGKLVSAICASPIVLDAAGVLGGKFACYPSCEKFAYEDTSTDSESSASVDSSEGKGANADKSASKSASDTPKATEKPLNGEYQPKASVVREGNLITAAGPATGVLFALEIIAYLLGQAHSQSIAEQMLIPYLKHSAEILRN